MEAVLSSFTTPRERQNLNVVAKPKTVSKQVRQVIIFVPVDKLCIHGMFLLGRKVPVQGSEIIKRLGLVHQIPCARQALS